MRTLKATLLLLICVALLCACGLKGPLYLPDENPASNPTNEQGSDADALKNTDDDEKSNTVSN